MRSVLALVVLLGCSFGDAEEEDKDGTESVDSDGDGLSDSQESELGTDPSSADSDDDSIEDADEVELGTDPLAADSDEDGYLDAWEVAEGSDPTDAESKIYTGGWPYNPNKDAIEDPGFSGSAAEGETLPRFAWVDQFGDTVDIYDFAGQGKPVVIDLSGAWCYWCNELAKLMEGKRSQLAGYGWDDIDVQLEEGQYHWVTVLDADVNGRKISEEDLADWYDEYPNPYIPILADEDQELAGWLGVVGYPTLIMVDENMVVTTYDANDYTAVLNAILELAE